MTTNISSLHCEEKYRRKEKCQTVGGKLLLGKTLDFLGHKDRELVKLVAASLNATPKSCIRGAAGNIYELSDCCRGIYYMNRFYCSF
ncbi:uncharacterized protein Dsimw501_GD28146 [Drosophila simulans]|uniref:Uncharacterized protein n=1 Tax=Drosophila simulans TaxID=7240 RepID=A0A0J9RFB1_DROSI|nr:uncharacterized protein Dsimw501_GD28146 [Drosophila simulans]